MDATNPILKAFGDALREKRKAAKFSQMELADRSDLHRTYIADIERGARNISLLSIARLAQGLGITMSALLNGVENNDPACTPLFRTTPVRQLPPR
jgi:transcriptional regulator with XRE-family HTH domain